MSGSSGEFLPNQGRWQAPVTGYSETRDNGVLQWRITAKPRTKAGSSGGLPRNQKKMAGSSGGLQRNQGQWRASVVGYCETRDKRGYQWWVTVKPGEKVGSSGGLQRHQRQRRASVVGYCETRDKGGLQ